MVVMNTALSAESCLIGVAKMSSEYNDYCQDCVIYGDDYYRNENGDMECRCSICPFNDDREYEMYD